MINVEELLYLSVFDLTVSLTIQLSNCHEAKIGQLA